MIFYLPIIFIIMGAANITLALTLYASAGLAVGVLTVVPSLAWFGLAFTVYAVQVLKQEVSGLTTEWQVTFKELASKFHSIRDSFEEVLKETRNLEAEIHRIESLTKIDYLEELRDRVGVCEMGLNIGNDRAN